MRNEAEFDSYALKDSMQMLLIDIYMLARMLVVKSLSYMNLRLRSPHHQL